MPETRRAVLALSRSRFDDSSGRPRELFSRLAGEREVIYVEEPCEAEPGTADSWELRFPAPHLLVARPLLQTPGRGFAGPSQERVAAMLVQLLRWQDVGDVVAWLDTPHALPIARALEARLLVYDRPSAFGPAGAEADPRLARLDAELVRAADLVLVALPSAEPWTRAAALVLSDLEEAERRTRPLGRRSALRAPEPRAARSGR